MNTKLLGLSSCMDILKKKKKKKKKQKKEDEEEKEKKQKKKKKEKKKKKKEEEKYYDGWELNQNSSAFRPVALSLFQVSFLVCPEYFN